MLGYVRASGELIHLDINKELLRIDSGNKGIMKVPIKTVIVTILALLLLACSQEAFQERFIPKAESEFAKDYLSRVRERDFEYVKRMLSPELQSQVNEVLLENMAAEFRDGELLSVEIIGSEVNVYSDQWQGNFTFEYHFESGWNIANTALQKTGNGYRVIGVNVSRTQASLKEINAFNFNSKSGVHYVVFGLTVLVPLFILFTLIVCIRTPIQSKKWLWITFILLGFGAFQFNWSTGAYAFQLLSIQLFGASAIATGPAAPLVLSASVPLGALVFWARRKSLIEKGPKSALNEANDVESSV